jgi:peptide/nickel transport system substrate-binding protein
VTQIIEANLADIGLTAKITLVPTLAPAKSNKTDPQIFYEYFQGIAPDPVSATEWFRCNQLGQWNFMYWCNPTFSRLDVAALGQTSHAQRNATYVREQQIWDQNANTVWLAYPNEVTATKSGITPAFYPWGDPALWAYKSH